jgi:hypothetical protein
VELYFKSNQSSIIINYIFVNPLIFQGESELNHNKLHL